MDILAYQLHCSHRGFNALKTDLTNYIEETICDTFDILDEISKDLFDPHKGWVSTHLPAFSYAEKGASASLGLGAAYVVFSVSSSAPLAGMMLVVVTTGNLWAVYAIRLTLQPEAERPAPEQVEEKETRAVTSLHSDLADPADPADPTQTSSLGGTDKRKRAYEFWMEEIVAEGAIEEAHQTNLIEKALQEMCVSSIQEKQTKEQKDHIERHTDSLTLAFKTSELVSGASSQPWKASDGIINHPWYPIIKKVQDLREALGLEQETDPQRKIELVHFYTAFAEDIISSGKSQNKRQYNRLLSICGALKKISHLSEPWQKYQELQKDEWDSNIRHTCFHQHVREIYPEPKSQRFSIHALFKKRAEPAPSA